MQRPYSAELDCVTNIAVGDKR